MDGKDLIRMEHWTLDQYREHLNKKSEKRKYRNQKTEYEGHIFDSQAEANRYAELKIMERSGIIKGFSIQPSFIIDKGIRYRPDFIVCGADGTVWVEDVKGVETQAFKIKEKMFNEKYPWMELKIIR